MKMFRDNFKLYIIKNKDESKRCAQTFTFTIEFYITSKLIAPTDDYTKVTEAMIRKRTQKEWTEVVESKVIDLLKSQKIEYLSKSTRLAIAISIVGSQKLDHYTIAFRLLCDWEHVGGQFWLVQEEILRFAVLYLFSFQLAGFELLVASANIRHQLLDILPRQLPSYITHKQVIHKINCLRVEFQWLLDEINSSSRKDAETLLQDYIGRYPLHKFVDWYIDWAQKLLRNYLAFSPRRIYISGQCGFHVKDEMAPMTLSGAKDCIAKDHVRRKEHSNSTQSSSFDRVNRIIKNNYQHRRGQNVIGASLDSPDFWKWQAIDYKSRTAIMDTDFMGSKLSFKKSRIRSTQVESNITDQNNFFDIDSPSNNLPESTNCIILRQRNAIVTAQKNTAIKMNCSIEPHSLRKSMSLGHIDKSDDKESTYLSPDAEDKKKKCCQFSYEREEDQLRSSRHQSLPLTPQASTISYDSRCTTVGCRLSKSVSSLSHCSDTCSGKMDLLEQRQLDIACRSLNTNTTRAMGDESVEYYISASDSDIVTVGDGFFKCLLNALFEVFSP